MSSGEAERLTVTLPDSVRQRVVEIGAEALGRLPAAEVPTPLRPFAKFAPAKRAKAAAIPMAAAMEGDGAFRARVAERVHERRTASGRTADDPPRPGVRGRSITRT